MIFHKELLSFPVCEPLGSCGPSGNWILEVDCMMDKTWLDLVWYCIHEGFVLLLFCVLCMCMYEHLNSIRILNLWAPEIVTKLRTLSRRELTWVQFH